MKKGKLKSFYCCYHFLLLRSLTNRHNSFWNVPFISEWTAKVCELTSKEQLKGERIFFLWDTAAMLGYLMQACDNLMAVCYTCQDVKPNLSLHLMWICWYFFHLSEDQWSSFWRYRFFEQKFVWSLQGSLMKNKAAKQKSKRKGIVSAFGCDLTEYLQSSGQDGKTL